LAENGNHYVELALRLANDPAWRKVLQEDLRQKKHVLYENAALVRELERFLIAAVAAATQGQNLPNWTDRETLARAAAARHDS